MLLSVPLNAAVVRGLAEGPRSLVDLRREAGSPPQTTMRGYLRSLDKAGVVERQQSGFPGAVGYGLTDSGRELLEVSEILAGWLARSPKSPMELVTVEAKRAIKALVDGWSSSMARAFATRPLSLTELDNVINALNYPSLERRLSAMRMLGLVEAIPGNGRGTPYTATAWLRSAIGPLMAAARWEQRHLPVEAPAITNRDVEAAFLLTLPMLRLPGDLSGLCRLAVQMRNGDLNRLAGVVGEVREGTIVSCIARLEGSVHGWSIGSIGAWLAAILDGDAAGLELGGETRLAAELIEGMRRALGGRAAVSEPAR